MSSVNFSNFEIHPSGPKMYFNGTFTYNRRSSDSTWVDCSLSGKITFAFSDGQYGIPFSGYGIGFTINTTDENSWHGNYYSIASYGSEGTSVNESWSFEITSGNITLWSNCDFGSFGSTRRYCSEGYDNIEMCSVACPEYNPHSNPSIEVNNAGADWTDRRNNRNVNYRYKTDGHNAKIKLSSEANWFDVSGTTSWSGWSGRSFNPKDCGIDYDAEYRVSGDIVDKSDGSYTGHTDGPTLYCYGSVKCSLGNIPSMVKGTAYNIPVTAQPNKFSRDNSHISYGVYIKKGSGSYTKYTISSDAGSGRNTYNDNYSFTPDADGVTYTFKAWVAHNVTGEEWTSSEKIARTYVNPVLGDISGLNIFSPQDTATYTWTNNASDITSAGESYIQKVSITNSNKTDTTYNNTSISLAPSGTYWVQSIFDNSNRSVDVLNSTLTVTLTNTDSGVSVSKSKTFKVQYKPTKNITDISVENQGKTIAIDDDTKTTIRWKYPYSTGATGVVSGFRIRVYSDSTYTTLVTTKNITVAYSDYITGPTYSIDLDNETDLQRGVMNYIDITPYYTYPSGGTKSYGPVVQVGQLIKPYKYMTKPVIEYPINNTTWHNKQFRVLLPLNEDRDFDTYTSTVQNAYAYSDMEIKVNSTVYAFSGTYTSLVAHPEIFSTDINKSNINNHKKLIAINPSLVSDFPDINDGSTFTISVRVQRGNYYFTNQEMQGQDSLGTTVKTWSDWSDPIILNKSSIAPQNLTVGLEIKASHYQTVHNWGLRLLACYPINNKDNGDVDQARGDFIDGSETQTATGSDEYEAVFRTMQNLMAGVNGYCTYDRAPVKFNSTPSFSALEEIITSAESGTDRYGSTGRNYMNLLTRYMNDYLK